MIAFPDVLRRRGAGGLGQRQAGTGPNAGKTEFASQGCGSCHTLAAAGASGKVGPDLDKLPEEAKRAGKPLEAFVRESIVSPNAYIEPGVPTGIMPSTFVQLPAPQIDALVKYLVDSQMKASSKK